ncbi:MAG: endonuclease-3 [Alphaproteobacteria bacterium]|jgi:endonuclease-3
MTEQARKIFKLFSDEAPTPRTELKYTTPFTLVAAVLLSAQATDKQVNIATKALFHAADSPEKMITLGLDVIQIHIQSIGLYKTKAKNLLATAYKLRDGFNSKVPNQRDLLETLPGVGRKTANVVLNELYNQPTMAVDTHIFRVSNRTGLAVGTTPLAIEKGLLAVIPEEYLLHAHHHLILHGRYICKARKPECNICKINPFCLYSNKIN